MQAELFNQLESKIEGMIDEVELLRMEVAELKEAKEQLEEEKRNSEVTLQRLLKKFEILDTNQ